MNIYNVKHHIKASIVYWSKRARLSIQTVFIGLLLLATVVTATVAISLQYVFSRSLAADTTLNIYEKTATDTQDYLAEVDERASAAVRILARFSRFDSQGKATEDTKALFAEAMLRNPLFHSVYVGFENGDFLGLINLDADPLTRQKLAAEADDRWLIVSVQGRGESRKRVMKFVDAKFAERHRQEQQSDFKSQRRPWFVDAKVGEIHKTTPYLFQQLQIPGQTYSTKLKTGKAVVAIDITLSAISNYLRQQDFDDGTEIYIYRESGDLVASNQQRGEAFKLPEVAPLALTEKQKQLIAETPYIVVSSELDWPPISFAASGWPYGYATDVLDYFSLTTGIEVRYMNGLPWRQLAEMFVDNELDVLQPVYFEPTRSWLGDLTKPFLDVPYGVVTQKGRTIKHIEQLSNKTVAIPEGWLLATHLEERFPQIKVVRVATVKDMFEAVRAGNVDAAMDTAPILNYIAQQYFIEDLSVSSPLAFGKVDLPSQLHFMVNKSKPGLAELFDTVIKQMGADYQQALAEKWLTHDFEQSSDLGLVPYKPLLKLAQQGGTEGLIRSDMNGQDYYTYVVPFAGVHDKQEYLAIVTPVADVLAAGLKRVQDSILITIVALLFLLPMVWLLAGVMFEPIRQLSVNSKNIAQRRYAQVEQVESGIVELDDLALSMDDMSESIQQHERAQTELLDSFIKMIAQAIDDKSAHTAGHCERVPELAFMLARQATEAESGIFANFKIDTQEQWREFEVAAWLHDCGKITTPEHIIDKGTKLETIYNRIHEIRMRFEVLWRDAEIDYWIAKTENDTDKQALLEQKQQKQQQLQEDFAFIAKANVGGEFMSDEDIECLQQLSQIEWKRYFDNTLGLSHIELARYPEANTALPVTETLLADKVEHIVPRTRNAEFPAEFGIKMEIPANLYNMGELYNLSVKRGTLSAEDRYKINEHIISTIKMLGNVPFPEELKNVPRYASTHHEKVSGDGYPRQLNGEALSVPERLMVLADIYEALTAADRPYKKAKPISEAIKILSFMVKDQHVDKEVFELFLRSGVYLDYAKRFLPAEQIDPVEIEQYL